VSAASERASACHLLLCAADLATPGALCRGGRRRSPHLFPLVYAAEALGIRYGNKAWELAWAARVQVQTDRKLPVTGERVAPEVLLEAAAMLQSGWAPKP